MAALKTSDPKARTGYFYTQPRRKDGSRIALPTRAADCPQAPGSAQAADGFVLMLSDLVFKQPKLRRPGWQGAGALVSFPLPKKTRGAERRQALVRKRRTR
jgi:hypothetical protein